MTKRQKTSSSGDSVVLDGDELVQDLEDLASECVKSNGRHARSYHRFHAHEVTSIRSHLLEWYDKVQRALPWRKTFNANANDGELAQRAYEVWVSEIMLQQTQVATVVPYYERWMKEWPTVFDLAKADAERVNQMWTGLGYYSRAKRLHEGAQLLVKDFGGSLPRYASELEERVPGIGRYTAGAISSIAFNERAPLVDGNVVRVFSRLRAIGGDPKSKPMTELIWSIADALVDGQRPGDFNQALMELGATVCTPKNPDCEACPVRSHCLAATELKAKTNVKREKAGAKRPVDELDVEDECDICLTWQEVDHNTIPYPRKVTATKKRDEVANVSIVERKVDGRSEFLLVQRPKKGLLAGLWEFPTITVQPPTDEQSADDDSRASLVLYLTQDLSVLTGDDVEKITPLGSISHQFSHINQIYQVQHVIVKNTIPRDETSSMVWKWTNKDDLDKEALPTGIKKSYALLEKHRKDKSQSITRFFKPKNKS